MLDMADQNSFAPLNRAYQSVFRQNHLSIGLVIPLEAYPTNPVPKMEHHIERVRLAEQLGFSALWMRDVPFNVPTFGDAGQTFDPFVYLGTLAASTETIGLGVASIILPLRHPAHVAKAASSADVLSQGRLLLGVASGDRPEEYPALGKNFHDRGDRFRESFEYIREMAKPYPEFSSDSGVLSGSMDLLPKPVADNIPLLITGGSQQDADWIASHGDGWMTYPRDIAGQAHVVSDYRKRISRLGLPDKPVMQSLYIDLLTGAGQPPQPIHLGFRSGIDFLRDYLTEIEALGVNHVALNLRFNQRDINETLKVLADGLLPTFAT